MNTANRFIAAAVTAIASVAGAQTPPPVRNIGPVLASSTEPFAAVSQVRALPGGRVIMHDLTGRRVVLLDSTFKSVTVIADTTPATGNAYGSRLGGLIAYRGDSTLFVDPQSISMLVIDPKGKIVRTIAAPLPNEVNALIGGQNGTPGYDPQGRLVYRSQIRPNMNFSKATAGLPQMPQLPESSIVVRVDLKTRKVDTAATFRIPKLTFNMTRDDNTGRVQISTTVNPMPWTDDWALLADGTLAIVRGQDYRVDLVSPDGKLTQGSKMAFDWQRMTDEDKRALIDSTRDAMEKTRAAQQAAQALASGDAKVTDPAAPGGRQRPVGDGGGMTIVMAGGPDGGGRGGAPVGFTLPPLNFVEPSEMPDYRPVFKQGASRGDAEGNLWIRTSKLVNGGAVYDVVNNKGELRDRIAVPAGRSIAGFGPGGVVYMGVVDVTGITHIERARVPVATAGAANNK
ncbi:MAG TPA: hypothetical protein VGQ30_07625 [Gemmatimonadaceae bacterium]|nr:hypothetical protein [Gemmatimonadaceae bacterium]